MGSKRPKSSENTVLCKVMGNPEKPKLSARPSNFQNLNFQSAFSRFINMLKYSPQCVESKYLIRILIRALVVEIFKCKLCGFVLFRRSKCSKLDYVAIIPLQSNFLI